MSTWRAIGWTVAFVLLSLLIMVPLVWLGTWLMLGYIPGAEEPGLTLVQQTLLQGGTGTFSAVVATWLVGYRWAGLSWGDLRWTGAWRTVPAALGGLALGAAAAALALVVAVPAGGASWIPDAGGPGAWLGAVGATSAVLLPAAAYEELLFRGVPLVLLAAAWGRVPAAVLLAVLFALGHLANPAVTTLGLVNIGVAGLFLTAVFYAPGGIWTATAAHLGWNATLAALDAPVSGLPFPMPLLDYLPGGPQWLTGGTFGPEGGLLATLALGVGLAIAMRWTRKDTSTT